MKKLILLLCVLVITAEAQYIETYKDTTAFPPYGIAGRIIRINGQLWKDEGGGWVKLPPPTFGFFHKDSVGQPVAGPDSSIFATIYQLTTKEPAIPTGTTSQYWRGDKTWATPAGGSYPWTEVVRTADTTKGTVTFVNIGQLGFNMDASGVYEIEGMVFFTRATAANGFTIAHNFTAAPTRTMIVGTGFAAVALGTDMRTENLMDTYLDSLAITATTVTMGEFVTFKGRIDNAASVNAYRLRMHAEIASNVTLLRGSFIRYRKIY